MTASTVWPLEAFFKIGMDRDITLPQTRDHGRFVAKGKHRINLGGGTKRMPKGVVSLGFAEGWNAETDAIPYNDGAVAEVWAVHFLEHINNLIPLLRECERVLMPNGVMNIVVPYGACHMAIHDVTHVRMFNEDSFPHLFNGTPYYKPAGDWKFTVTTNVIMGVKGENLALLTQLERTR